MGLNYLLSGFEFEYKRKYYKLGDSSAEKVISSLRLLVEGYDIKDVKLHVHEKKELQTGMLPTSIPMKEALKSILR